MTERYTKEIIFIFFHKMEINEEFVNMFWKLFGKGIHSLEFDQCTLLDDYKYSDLLDGDYHVEYLKIIGNNLTLDDIDSIFSLLYPYTLRKITLIGEGLDDKVIAEMALKRLGSFASNLIECIKTSSQEENQNEKGLEKNSSSIINKQLSTLKILSMEESDPTVESILKDPSMEKLIENAKYNKGGIFQLFSYLKSIEYKKAKALYESILLLWKDENDYDIEDNGEEFTGFYKIDKYSF